MTQYYFKIDGTLNSQISPCTVKKSYKGTGGGAKAEMAYRDGTDYDNLKYGQEFTAYRTSDDEKIFGGILEEPTRTQDRKTRLSLKIQEYIYKTKKILVNETYRNEKITDIINDLCSKYLPSDFTYTKVSTTTKTLDYIQFKRKYLYDVFRDLAKYEDWLFFIDVDKDFNFKASGSTFSGVTLTQGVNLKSFKETTDTQRFVNKVRVTGGLREYTRTQLFSGDGTELTFTLEYKPISVKVDEYIAAAWVEQKGYAKDSGATTDYDYDIDAEAYQVIYKTGNPPANASNNVRITYVYGVPVKVEGSAEDSISEYITSEIDISDTNILQRNEAKELVQATLSKYQLPLKIYDCLVKNIEPDVDIGETVRIVDTNRNIDSYYVVVEIEYALIGKILSTRISVTETQDNFLELMRGIVVDLNALKSDNKTSTDIVTKLKNYIDQAGIKDDGTDYLQLSTRSLDGHLMIGHPIYGKIGPNGTGYPIGPNGNSYSRQV